MEYGDLMKLSKTLVLIATVVTLAASPLFADAGTQNAKQAKITAAQARGIALKAYPGKIVEEELEAEYGGSGLRYSFTVVHGKVKHEVGVDARTGKILENCTIGVGNCQ
jgi:Peptidase propeptide and YPEB domain